TTAEESVKGIREENTVFGWTQSTGVEEYKLIISKNEDLSDPVFEKSVGTKTLTYVYNQTLVSLKANTTYYYSVIAINDIGETMIDGGIHSFKTRVTDINTFGYNWSIVGDVYEDDGNIVVNASTSANDTNNIALVQPEASNFTVDVVISGFKPNELHQQVGIIFYEHDTSYIKFNRSYTNDIQRGVQSGNYFEFKGNSASVVNIHVADGILSEKIYLKAILKGSVLTTYYSADGVIWAEVGVSTDVDFIKMKVGVYAATWLNSSVTATIESFKITYSDVQPETDKAVVWDKQFTKNGNIKIDGNTVTIAGGATDTENYLSANISGIKQGVAVKVNFAPASNNHQAGILFFDGNTYFKFIRTNDGGDCVKIEFGATDGSDELITFDGASKVLLSRSGPVWLKYLRDGAKINFYYGFDGETFLQIGEDHILNGNLYNAEHFDIALFASRWGDGNIEGYFLDFVEETENIRVAVTIPIEYATETVVTGIQGNQELVFTRTGTDFYADAVRYGEPITVKAER
ncbi:MAG: DUF1349 domain-containing protein, partial [Clostridia bacterium]|nr:DUF1349 domain-containing protein [Clostridia bacterium]